MNGALYFFGHGLSYTTFAYSNLRISPRIVSAAGASAMPPASRPTVREGSDLRVTVSVDVTNTGARAGDEVVQLYTHELVTSVTTYEAYNTYGGTSLYNNNTNGSIYSYAHATKVSFDRPFNPGDSNGAGHFLWYEYPMLRWAEKNGFDMTYTTNIDTDLNTNPLTNHKAFFSVGHDEYWSYPMRRAFEDRIASGKNVAFFSGNICWWQIRCAPDLTRITCYKDKNLDPLTGVEDSLVTVNWFDDPVFRPENPMTGTRFAKEVSRINPIDSLVRTVESGTSHSASTPASSERNWCGTSFSLSTGNSCSWNELAAACAAVSLSLAA